MAQHPTSALQRPAAGMNPCATIGEVLASDYRALEQIDQALRQAERNLLAAHFQPTDRIGPRPEVIFQEVLSLRAKSRQLLAGLGEKFAVRHQATGGNSIARTIDGH